MLDLLISHFFQYVKEPLSAGVSAKADFRYSLFTPLDKPPFPPPACGQAGLADMVVNGGEYRSRTDDLLRARQAL